MFSTRILTTDHYMGTPLPGLDVTRSDFRESEIKQVPVLRVFGVTPIGQKTCMHIHGVFPYLYVPYDGTEPLGRYLKQFSNSIDKALNVAFGKVTSTQQHVYKIVLVSGIPFYGYYEKEIPFLKIYFFNPRMTKKVADLLLGGAILNKIYQPYEAHIPYNLQMFMDYNLYGMNMINVSAVKFRQNCNEGSPPPRYDKDFSGMTSPRNPMSQSFNESFRPQTPSRMKWDHENIPADCWLNVDIQKQSTCELEVDIVAADILNRLEVGDNIGSNPGLAALWEDERQRRQERGMTLDITPPSSPGRGDIPWTDAEADLQEKLREILQHMQPHTEKVDSPSAEKENSQLYPATPSSEVEIHHSQQSKEDDTMSCSSDDTVVINETPPDERPIVSEISILRVVSSSQSFSKQNQELIDNEIKPSPSSQKDQLLDTTQDQNLAELLASLAEAQDKEDQEVGDILADSPANSQRLSQILCKSVESRVQQMEEQDSILSQFVVSPTTASPGEPETKGNDDVETLEMSQIIDYSDEETNEKDADESDLFDLEGMDSSWNSSALIAVNDKVKDTESSGDDDTINIPQLDGPVEDKQISIPLKKRLGIRGPRTASFGMTVFSSDGETTFKSSGLTQSIKITEEKSNKTKGLEVRLTDISTILGSVYENKGEVLSYIPAPSPRSSQGLSLDFRCLKLRPGTSLKDNDNGSTVNNGSTQKRTWPSRKTKKTNYGLSKPTLNVIKDVIKATVVPESNTVSKLSKQEKLPLDKPLCALPKSPEPTRRTSERASKSKCVAFLKDVTGCSKKRPNVNISPSKDTIICGKTVSENLKSQQITSSDDISEVIHSNSESADSSSVHKIISVKGVHTKMLKDDNSVVDADLPKAKSHDSQPAESPDLRKFSPKVMCDKIDIFLGKEIVSDSAEENVNWETQPTYIELEYTNTEPILKPETKPTSKLKLKKKHGSSKTTLAQVVRKKTPLSKPVQNCDNSTCLDTPVEMESTVPKKSEEDELENSTPLNEPSNTEEVCKQTSLLAYRYVKKEANKLRNLENIETDESSTQPKIPDLPCLTIYQDAYGSGGKTPRSDGDTYSNGGKTPRSEGYDSDYYKKCIIARRHSTDTSDSENSDDSDYTPRWKLDPHSRTYDSRNFFRRPSATSPVSSVRLATKDENDFVHQTSLVNVSSDSEVPKYSDISADESDAPCLGAPVIPSSLFPPSATSKKVTCDYGVENRKQQIIPEHIVVPGVQETFATIVEKRNEISCTKSIMPNSVTYIPDSRLGDNSDINVKSSDSSILIEDLPCLEIEKQQNCDKDLKAMNISKNDNSCTVTECENKGIIIQNNDTEKLNSLDECLDIQPESKVKTVFVQEQLEEPYIVSITPISPPIRKSQVALEQDTTIEAVFEPKEQGEPYIVSITPINSNIHNIINDDGDGDDDGGIPDSPEMEIYQEEVNTPTISPALGIDLNMPYEQPLKNSADKLSDYKDGDDESYDDGPPELVNEMEQSIEYNENMTSEGYDNAVIENCEAPILEPFEGQTVINDNLVSSINSVESSGGYMVNLEKSSHQDIEAERVSVHSQESNKIVKHPLETDHLKGEQKMKEPVVSVSKITDVSTAETKNKAKFKETKQIQNDSVATEMFNNVPVETKEVEAAACGWDSIEKSDDLSLELREDHTGCDDLPIIAYSTSPTKQEEVSQLVSLNFAMSSSVVTDKDASIIENESDSQNLVNSTSNLANNNVSTKVGRKEKMPSLVAKTFTERIKKISQALKSKDSKQKNIPPLHVETSLNLDISTESKDSLGCTVISPKDKVSFNSGQATTLAEKKEKLRLKKEEKLNLSKNALTPVQKPKRFDNAFQAAFDMLNQALHSNNFASQSEASTPTSEASTFSSDISTILGIQLSEKLVKPSKVHTEKKLVKRKSFDERNKRNPDDCVTFPYASKIRYVNGLSTSCKERKTRHTSTNIDGEVKVLKLDCQEHDLRMIGSEKLVIPFMNDQDVQELKDQVKREVAHNKKEGKSKISVESLSLRDNKLAADNSASIQSSNEGYENSLGSSVERVSTPFSEGDSEVSDTDEISKNMTISETSSHGAVDKNILIDLRGYTTCKMIGTKERRSSSVSPTNQEGINSGRWTECIEMKRKEILSSVSCNPATALSSRTSDTIQEINLNNEHENQDEPKSNQLSAVNVVAEQKSKERKERRSMDFANLFGDGDAIITTKVIRKDTPYLKNNNRGKQHKQEKKKLDKMLDSECNKDNRINKSSLKKLESKKEDSTKLMVKHEKSKVNSNRDKISSKSEASNQISSVTMTHSNSGTTCSSSAGKESIRLVSKDRKDSKSGHDAKEKSSVGAKERKSSSSNNSSKDKKESSKRSDDKSSSGSTRLKDTSDKKKRSSSSKKDKEKNKHDTLHVKPKLLGQTEQTFNTKVAELPQKTEENCHKTDLRLTSESNTSSKDSNDEKIPDYETFSQLGKLSDHVKVNSSIDKNRKSTLGSKVELKKHDDTSNITKSSEKEQSESKVLDKCNVIIVKSSISDTGPNFEKETNMKVTAESVEKHELAKSDIIRKETNPLSNPISKGEVNNIKDIEEDSKKQEVIKSHGVCEREQNDVCQISKSSEMEDLCDAVSPEDAINAILKISEDNKKKKVLDTVRDHSPEKKIEIPKTCDTPHDFDSADVPEKAEEKSVLSTKPLHPQLLRTKGDSSSNSRRGSSTGSEKGSEKGDADVDFFSMLATNIDSDISGNQSSDYDSHKQLHTPPLILDCSDKSECDRIGIKTGPETLESVPDSASCDKGIKKCNVTEVVTESSCSRPLHNSEHKNGSKEHKRYVNDEEKEKTESKVDNTKNNEKETNKTGISDSPTPSINNIDESYEIQQSDSFVLLLPEGPDEFDEEEYHSPAAKTVSTKAIKEYMNDEKLTENYLESSEEAVSDDKSCHSKVDGKKGKKHFKINRNFSSLLNKQKDVPNDTSVIEGENSFSDKEEGEISENERSHVGKNGNSAVNENITDDFLHESGSHSTYFVGLDKPVTREKKKRKHHKRKKSSNKTESRSSESPDKKLDTTALETNGRSHHRRKSHKRKKHKKDCKHRHSAEHTTESTSDSRDSAEKEASRSTSSEADNLVANLCTRNESSSAFSEFRKRKSIERSSVESDVSPPKKTAIHDARTNLGSDEVEINDERLSDCKNTDNVSESNREKCEESSSTEHIEFKPVYDEEQEEDTILDASHEEKKNQAKRRKMPKRLDSAFCKPSAARKRKRTENKKFRNTLSILHQATLDNLKSDDTGSPSGCSEHSIENIATITSLSVDASKSSNSLIPSPMGEDFDNSQMQVNLKSDISLLHESNGVLEKNSKKQNVELPGIEMFHKRVEFREHDNYSDTMYNLAYLSPIHDPISCSPPSADSPTDFQLEKSEIFNINNDKLIYCVNNKNISNGKKMYLSSMHILSKFQNSPLATVESSVKYGPESGCSRKNTVSEGTCVLRKCLELKLHGTIDPEAQSSNQVSPLSPEVKPMSAANSLDLPAPLQDHLLPIVDNTSLLVKEVPGSPENINASEHLDNIIATNLQPCSDAHVTNQSKKDIPIIKPVPQIKEIPLEMKVCASPVFAIDALCKELKKDKPQTEIKEVKPQNKLNDVQEHKANTDIFDKGVRIIPTSMEECFADDPECSSSDDPECSSSNSVCSSRHLSPSDKETSPKLSSPINYSPASPIADDSPIFLNGSDNSSAVTVCEIPSGPVVDENTISHAESPASPGNNSPASTFNQRPASSPNNESPASPFIKSPASPSNNESPASPTNNESPASPFNESPASPSNNESPASTFNENPVSPSNNESPASPSNESPASPSNNESPASPFNESPASPSNNKSSASPSNESPASPSDNESPASPFNESPASPPNNESPASPFNESPTSPPNNKSPASPTPTPDQVHKSQVLENCPASPVAEKFSFTIFKEIPSSPQGISRTVKQDIRSHEKILTRISQSPLPIRSRTPSPVISSISDQSKNPVVIPLCIEHFEPQYEIKAAKSSKIKLKRPSLKRRSPVGNNSASSFSTFNEVKQDCVSDLKKTKFENSGNNRSPDIPFSSGHLSGQKTNASLSKDSLSILFSSHDVDYRTMEYNTSPDTSRNMYYNDEIDMDYTPQYHSSKNSINKNSLQYKNLPENQNSNHLYKKHGTGKKKSSQQSNSQQNISNKSSSPSISSRNNKPRDNSDKEHDSRRDEDEPRLPRNYANSRKHLSNTNIECIISPVQRPPRRSVVLDDCIHKGLTPQTGAFCSKSQDVPERPRELGGKILKIDSSLVKDLPEYRSSLQGVRHWQKKTLNSEIHDMTQGTTDEVLEQLDKQPQLRIAMFGDTDMIITPSITAPSPCKVKQWLESKNLYMKIKAEKHSTNKNISAPIVKATCADDEGKKQFKKGPNFKTSKKTQVKSVNTMPKDYTFQPISPPPQLRSILKSPDASKEEFVSPPQKKRRKSIISPTSSISDKCSQSPELKSPQMLETPTASTRTSSRLQRNAKSSKDTSPNFMSSTPARRVSFEDQLPLVTPIPRRTRSRKTSSDSPATSTESQYKEDMLKNVEDDEDQDEVIPPTPERQSPVPTTSTGKIRSIRRLSTGTDATLRRVLLTSQLKNQFASPIPLANHDVSQIDGPTPKNMYGFKVNSQCIQDAKALHEYQHITVLSLELHIRTRGDYRPDPENDPICAVFYSIFHDIPPDQGDRHINGVILVDECCGNKSKPGGSKCQDQLLLQKSGLPSVKTTYVQNEAMLIEEVIVLMRKWDPDILVGYEITMLSWGFLIQRANQLSIDLKIKLSRIPETGKEHKGSKNQNDDGDITSDITIPGRIVLNLWKIIRHEVTLNVYSFENVMYHVLHKRVPSYPFKSLTFWYDHKLHIHRWRTIEYHIMHSRGNLQIIEKLDLIGQTSEFARVFGIEFYHVLSRGSQYRVESMMLRIAKPMNFIPVSPSVQQRSRMRAPECIPLTMEPQSKFYTDPVVVLDFQSLYPSIMMAHNYCFSTCLGRIQMLEKANEGTFEFGCTSLDIPPRLLQKLKDDINICPNGVCFVKEHIKKGILPRMVGDILKTRLMVKKSMKDYKGDNTLQRLLHARQLSLKLIANVTFGYTSANFSGRMPCMEIGDSIVRKARETLERAIELVQQTEKWGAEVVYGDTDSMFILMKGRTKDEAFKIGQEIADAVTNSNPKPIKLKFEKVYLPCVLQTKKRYVGFMYETIDQKEPVYDAKGIETVRRDSCAAVSKILEKSIKILFTTHDISRVKSFVQKQWTKLSDGRVSIQDCVFAKEYRGMAGYKPGACVPALDIARRRLSKDRRSEPRPGERVPYVIVCGTPGLPLIQLVREPQELLIDPSLRINATYYITKQIIPPLVRIFMLMGVDVMNWYQELPRVVRSAPQGVSAANDLKKGTISQYFHSLNCPVCDELTQKGMCIPCKTDTQRVAVILGSRIRKIENTFFQLYQVCTNCMGSQDMEIPCTSLDCPIMFRINRAARDMTQVVALKQLEKKLLHF